MTFLLTGEIARVSRMVLLLPLPGNAGMVAGFWCRKRDRGCRLIEKGCDNRQQLLRIVVQYEVAGVRYHSKLSVWNKLKHLQHVLEKVAQIGVIAGRDEDRCCD